MLKGIHYVLLLFLLSAASAFAQSAQLWKTGQNICYNGAGNTISCTGTGQDGEVQAGIAWPVSRFTNNLDGTVTDKLTGLIWSQDANAPDPTASSCATAKTMLWQDALDYVMCLNTNNYLGQSDWRLPNRKELHSLTDYSQSSPSLQSGHPFTNVQTARYWSSSTSASNTIDAWRVSMSSGYVVTEVKTSFLNVWPIRAGQ